MLLQTNKHQNDQNLSMESPFGYWLIKSAPQASRPWLLQKIWQLRSAESLIRLFVASFLLFLGANPAWDKLEGVFMIVKGEVKVISPDQKSEFARVGMKITEGYSVITGGDGRAKIVMSDKNILNIHSGSNLVIAAYQNDGVKKKVELSLEEGSVRALVKEKYDDYQNTFRIKTPTAVAGVRGTDFFVSFDVKTQLSAVKTFAGLVAVGHPEDVLKGGSRSAALALIAAGQQIELNAKGNNRPEPRPIPPQELKNLDKQTDIEKSQDDTAINQKKHPEQNQFNKEQASYPQQVSEPMEKKHEFQEAHKEIQGNKTHSMGSANPPRQNHAATPPPQATTENWGLVKIDDLKVEQIKAGVQDSLPAPRLPAQIAPQRPEASVLDPGARPTPNTTPSATINPPGANNLINETIRNQVNHGTRKLPVRIDTNENPPPHHDTNNGATQ